jgi:hypothetical protein
VGRSRNDGDLESRPQHVLIAHQLCPNFARLGQFRLGYLDHFCVPKIWDGYPRGASLYRGAQSGTVIREERAFIEEHNPRVVCTLDLATGAKM